MIAERLEKLLRNVTFIDIATCDFEGRPNVAPKFLLKQDKDLIYLVDYTIGRTYRNLKINPRVSLPAMDLNTLIGYQINGVGEMLKEGKEHKQLSKELRERVKKLSVERLVEGIKSAKPHQSFEIVFPKRVEIFKIKVEEVVEIGPSGELKREKV